MRHRLSAALALFMVFAAAVASIATGPPYDYLRATAGPGAVAVSAAAPSNTVTLRACGGEPYQRKREFLIFPGESANSDITVTVSSAHTSSSAVVRVTLVNGEDPDKARALVNARSITFSQRVHLFPRGDGYFCGDVRMTVSQEFSAADETVGWHATANLMFDLSANPLPATLQTLP